MRLLATAADMAACDAVQMATWNMADAGDVVPVHQLLTAAKYGGLVIGAFDGDEMIGLSYAFVGLYGGRPVLCSHMLAVLPAYRGRGVGVRLKLEQRRLALERGLDTMHWTYDPLELVNGNLNIRRLGGIARIYERDLYGAMTDGLNAGLPSDRLVVEWDLRSPRTEAALTNGSAPQPDLATCVPYDGSALPEGGRPLALTVPRNMQAIRRDDPAAARHWRMHVRAACERAFAAGYILSGAHDDGYIFTLAGGRI